MENMMLLIYQDFITGNLTVRFTIPVFSVMFKNSAAITNTRSGSINWAEWNADFEVLSELSVHFCQVLEEIETGMIIAPVEREVVNQALVSRVHISADLCLIKVTKEPSSGDEVGWLVH